MKSKLVSFITLLAGLLVSNSAYAEEVAAASSTGSLGLIGLGAGLAVGFCGLGCGLGQGKAVSAALEATGRNPSASGKVLTQMILGLAFIEVMLILSFVVALGLTDKL